MPVSDILCLNLAIARLITSEANQYAIWVLRAPYPGGYVLHDCVWPADLTHTWHAWQSMFSLRGLPQVPHVAAAPIDLPMPPPNLPESGNLPYGGRLMQHLGISLWQWLFEGPIRSSLDQSQGIAMGQSRSLRLRLEIRDPDLIALPWEIMQPQPGRQAISLSQQVLFSRTTSDVAPLTETSLSQSLKILLVLGQDTEPTTAPADFSSSKPVDPLAEARPALDLEQEATALARILTNFENLSLNTYGVVPVPSQVDTLLQPTPAELIEHLESGKYNIFFYAGHGVPAPDGGSLLLRAGTALSGTELAQVLTRCRVKLAVFNACWGAQPDHDAQRVAIPRSSLAEVLIHHGVPAVLGMRDSITDQEALSFIQAFAQALSYRMAIDQAVAVARQHLLTLYKFNQPAWTLPVLYMHPEFDGRLVVEEEKTILPPEPPTWMGSPIPMASLRMLGQPAKVWPIRGGMMRIGSRGDNDLVLPEVGVSREHAEIFCRDISADGEAQPTYFLRDFSRYGTLILGTEGWQRIHRQEVPLQSGAQLKFGNPLGQTLEFLLEQPNAHQNE